MFQTIQEFYDKFYDKFYAKFYDKFYAKFLVQDYEKFLTLFFLFNKFPICLTRKITIRSCWKNRNKKLLKLKTEEKLSLDLWENNPKLVWTWEEFAKFAFGSGEKK